MKENTMHTEFTEALAALKVDGRLTRRVRVAWTALDTDLRNGGELPYVWSAVERERHARELEEAHAETQKLRDVIASLKDSWSDARLRTYQQRIQKLETRIANQRKQLAAKEISIKDDKEDLARLEANTFVLRHLAEEMSGVLAQVAGCQARSLAETAKRLLKSMAPRST